MGHMVQPAYSLNDCLKRLNKDDLHHIRRMLRVENASQLNKQDLVDCLAREIITRLETTLRYFDKKRYQYIKLVIDSGGKLSFDELLDEEEFDPFQYRDYGLLFIDPDTKDVIIPYEVVDRLQHIDQVWLRMILKRNTEWIQLTMGMLYYYGTLHLDKLIELIARYIDELDVNEYISVIERYAEYDEGCYFNDSSISYYTVLDPEMVITEHEMRPEVDFYPFSKSELIQAANDDYIERTKEYQELQRYLMHTCRADREDVEIILLELHDHIQNGASLSSAIDYLQFQLTFSGLHQIQGMTDRLVNWMNSVKLWWLKGYSSDELRNQLNSPPDSVLHLTVEHSDVGGEVYDFATKKKIGRNDPCPCGSGKKFKKCCGS